MPKATISHSDDVIQFNGKNQEDVLAHSDIVTAVQSVDGISLYYNDSANGNPNLAIVYPGDWVGSKGVYRSVESFEVTITEEDPEPEVVAEPEPVMHDIVITDNVEVTSTTE